MSAEVLVPYVDRINSFLDFADLAGTSAPVLGALVVIFGTDDATFGNWAVGGDETEAILNAGAALAGIGIKMV